MSCISLIIQCRGTMFLVSQFANCDRQSSSRTLKTYAFSGEIHGFGDNDKKIQKNYGFSVKYKKYLLNHLSSSILILQKKVS